MRWLFLSIHLILVFSGCRNNSVSTPQKAHISYTERQDSIVIELRETRPGNHLITATTYHFEGDTSYTSRQLSYPVLKWSVADIDNDGARDILLTVVKTTRLDSIARKRLFILELDRGKFRSKWLSSRLTKPLVDYKVVKGPDGFTYLLSLEQEQDGSYLTALYRWKGFGLEFIKYLDRHVPQEENTRFADPPYTPAQLHPHS